jgi:hypothetical protein
MKTNRILWWGMALLIGGCAFGWWRGPSHGQGPAPAATEASPAASAASPTDRVQTGPADRFTLYQHAEDVPSWAVPYGKEFWRRPLPAGNPSQKPASSEDHPALNLGDVIDRVSHAFTTANASGPPKVQAKTYAAVLEGSRMLFSPAHPPTKPKAKTSLGGARPASTHEQRLAALSNRTPETPEEEDLLMAKLSALAAEEAAAAHAQGQSTAQETAKPRRPLPSLPESDPETEAAFQTASIRLGDRTVYEPEASLRQWAVLGNTAQAVLDSKSGLIEHFEAGEQGLAATWVLPHRPPGADALVIEARLTGLVYAAQTAGGHHYADRAGAARLRVGNVTLADAAGGRWKVAIEARQEVLRITVPASILAEANYPLAIDPLISPEFGMDSPIVVPASAAQQNPAVAANGTGFLVAWEDQRISGPSGSSIYGARVTAAGAISDPNGIAISPVGASSPAVAANGGGFLVVWVDGRNVETNGLDIYGARINSGGQVLDAGGFAISLGPNDQLAPAATANGADSFVVWQDGRNTTNGSDIYGARVTSAGVVSDVSGIPICTAAGPQASPAVAFNGVDFLAVWTDERDGSDFDIYGARVSTAGSVLDPSGIAISTVVGGEFYPKVAASGSNFLAVWEDDRNAGSGFVDIYGDRVSGAGTVMDGGGFLVSTGSSDRHTPAVAASPTNYLVVWLDQRNLATTGQDIYGARVTTNGGVTDAAGFAINTATNDQTTPVVAFNGTQYLVAWTDARNMATTDLDIYGALVSPSATVSPTSGFVVSTGAADEEAPATASNGSNYLVVWQDYRNSAADGADLYGVRVSTAGEVLDPSAIAISTAAGDQVSPNVATDGTNYLVVWQDYRNAETTGVDIYGARVTGTGTVEDPSGIPISTASSDQLAPAAAAGTGGYLVVWQDGRNLATNGDDIYGSRVSSAGTVLDASGIAICTANAAQYSAAVAFNSTNYLVVWSDERNLGATGVDVYGTRVTPSGTVLDSPNLPIIQAAGDDVFPAVASAAGGFLVVWEDGRNSATTGDEIYGARVTGAGVVSDPGGLAIAVAPGFEATPAVAASGTNYFVVWEDDRNEATNGADIYGSRVTTGGVVLDPAGVAINTGLFDQQVPKLASGSPGVFLVVCQSLETGADRIVGNFAYLANFPIITQITVTNGSATLTWLSIPGRTYQAQFSSNLASPGWSNLVPEIVASGAVTSQTDTNSSAAKTRFYRVVLLP